MLKMATDTTGSNLYVRIASDDNTNQHTAPAYP